MAAQRPLINIGRPFYDRLITNLEAQHERLKALQQRYFNSLSEDEKQIIYFYNRYGDEIMNMYLRNRRMTPAIMTRVEQSDITYRGLFENQDTILFKALGKLKSANEDEQKLGFDLIIYALMHAIDNAPTSPIEFYVARGAQTNYVETSGSFLSTTLNPNIATGFSYFENEANIQYLKSIKIHPRTPFIYMPCIVDAMPVLKAGVHVDDIVAQVTSEYEVLLPVGVNIERINTYRTPSTPIRFINDDTVMGFNTYEVSKLGNRSRKVPYSHNGGKTRRRRRLSKTSKSRHL
jgi:hypothetical protein